MAKSVIYIDTEDDITAVIGKVKAADTDIVALVPPKRVGMLQSVVNLKLLKRAAAGTKKHVVLITADTALRSLAGGVMIPTAKNLQSRPEIVATKAPIDDGEDVVNGGELTVGELDDALGTGEMADAKETKAIGAATIAAAAPAGTRSPNTPRQLSKKEAKKLAVPDFMKFRKRLWLIGLAVIGLGILIWWAFWVAPTASVAIRAKTEIANVEESLNLDPNADFNESENLLPSETKELKKTVSVDFDATGKKDVGERARGQVVFRNCETPTAQTIRGGTVLSVNGQNYLTQADVSVPGGTGSFVTGCTSAGTSAPVAISAAEIGENYNLASGTALAVSGHSNELRATTSSAVTGGSKRTVTVVSQADVERARGQLQAANENQVRDELAGQFGAEQTSIRESFQVEAADPVASPAVDAEATKAKLTADTTYRMTAVATKDLDSLLNNVINADIEDKSRQSIYDNGRKELKVSDYQSLENGRASLRISTTGYIGSKINQDRLKQDMAGKRYGEIESLVKQVPNVEDVTINFSPFWVTSAPAADKITITLDVVKDGE